jgi:hypothetical protein
LDENQGVTSSFIDELHCEVVVAHGKNNAIKALQKIESKFFGILCVVDVDFCDLVGLGYESENLLYTDDHDIEVMIFNSPAFDKVLLEYGSQEKIKDKGGINAVRDWLLDSVVPLAVLRLRSLDCRFDFKFKGMDYPFIDRDTLDCDSNRMVSYIAARSDKNYAINIAKAEITKFKNPKDFGCGRICNGHDLAAVFGIALRKAIGNRPSAEVTGALIEAALRLAYEDKFFRATRLYGAIKAWENNNAFRVLH